MDPEHALDDARRSAGFLTVDEVRALAPRVRVLDPTSVLVGRSVEIGDGTVLYPGVVLETRGTGGMSIGRDTVVGPGPVTLLADGARVEVGDRVALGPGGVTIIAAGSHVRVGSGARIRGGAWIEGPAEIGAGAQVLGTVAVRDVVLAEGGTHAEADPDRRAAVVKGTGRVHGVRLALGEVVEAGAAVSPHRVERQRAHHPKVPRA